MISVSKLIIFDSNIMQLKRKDLNAVILYHFYQDEAIQDIADLIGDSLDLSVKATTTDADVIMPGAFLKSIQDRGPKS